MYSSFHLSTCTFAYLSLCVDPHMNLDLAHSLEVLLFTVFGKSLPTVCLGAC